MYWILWCILGAILIVAEVFTSGFVLLWFGIGALAAALAGIVGIDNLGIQFLIFAVGFGWPHRRLAHDLRQLFFTRKDRRLVAHRR